MTYTPAIDVSQWQGNIDFSQISEPIVILRASYNYQNNNYFDSSCNFNYYNAKQNGKAVGLYHFAGGTDPASEAEFFVQACSPLDEGDVLVLDWEVEINDPVGWSRNFIQHIIDRIHTIPLIYMDTDRENRFDWSPVIQQNVGLYIADYRYGPEETVPIRHWPMYVMHQFNSSPIDHDAWFGTVDEFKQYGFHASGPTPPPPQPTPSPEPTPVPQPTPTPVPAPTPAPTPNPVPDTPPETPKESTKSSLWDRVIEFFNKIKAFLQGYKKG